MFAIVEKQPRLAKAMQNIIQKDRLGHAYLFDGVRGSGQVEMAQFISAGLFCEHEDKPCGECLQCQRICHEENADVFWIKDDAKAIKIDQIRELKQDIALTGFESKHKIFIIEAIERMTLQAANSLLKFLEEPHLGVVLLLTTYNLRAVLPTIQSRCQVIQFPPLPPQKVREVLIEQGVTQSDARLLCGLTGDVSKAMTLNEDSIFQVQHQKSWEWLLLILNQDVRAMSMIVNDWIKLTKGRLETGRLLAIVNLYLRDLLLLQIGDEAEDTLLLRKTDASYQKISRRLSVEYLTVLMKQIAECQAMIESNVGVQGVLEYFVLKSWQMAD